METDELTITRHHNGITVEGGPKGRVLYVGYCVSHAVQEHTEDWPEEGTVCENGECW